MLHTLLLLLLLVPFTQALWPIPRVLTNGTTLLKLASNFDITVNIPNAPQDLLNAVDRTNSFLQNDKLGRLIVGRGATDSAALQNARTLPSLTISLVNGHTARPIAVEAIQPVGTRDESYSLQVPGGGSGAVLTANSTLGLFRGLATFSQLWYEFNGVIYMTIAPVTIKDAPAFPYRGTMLDTSRHFFPVSDIKRVLDAMSWVHLNTFHWHSTDSQSFPLAFPGFEEVAQAGAYSETEMFSPDDVKDVVAYAAERGIDVLLEIDTPGHTSVIGASHPEHVACYLTPWPTFANEPPAGQLRLASASTTNFTANLISAVASALSSQLFHTGGDELNTKCYAQDPQTQADLTATGRTLEEALNVFTQATHGALADLGKTPVVWEEMVLNHTVQLSNETVVMVWISSQDAAAVAAKGFRVVHASKEFFYLDCGAGYWIGNNPTGVNSCDPFKSWQKAYTFDPLANLTSDEIPFILGGQQLLWAEQSGPENLDSIMWPRAATSAEVFWTGGTLPDGTNRTLGVKTALHRLHELRYRMVQRGVKAIPLQPHFCALRDGMCDLK